MRREGKGAELPPKRLTTDTFRRDQAARLECQESNVFSRGVADG